VETETGLDETRRPSETPPPIEVLPIPLIKTPATEEKLIMNITNNEANDWFPAWSPNGKRIAFVSDRESYTDQLYIMSPDGSEVIKLTNDIGSKRNPDWSSDGKKIVFVSDIDGYDRIFVITIDGRLMTKLTFDPPDLSYPDNFTSDDYPAWSPDGKKIAFIRHINGEDYEIFIMDAVGGQPTQLTYNSTGVWDLEFSLDGKKLYFTSDREVYYERLYVMDIETGEQTLFLDSDYKVWQASWSNDQTKIAFVTFLNNLYEIDVINTDDTSLLQLIANTETDIDPIYGDPCWSPDGKRIAFVSNRDGNREILIMSSDTSINN